MSKNGWTPGPWTFEPETRDTFPIVSPVDAADNQGWFTASVIVSGGEDPRDRANANARLISAAPDMAEALQYILDDVEPAEFALSYVARGKAEAALKKARGEQ